MLDREAKNVVASGRPQELRERSTSLWVRQFFMREASAEAAEVKA
jgi:hypothetical protein